MRKTLSPGYILRVTYRVEMGCSALRWATVIRSGPCRLSASVNVLTEAFKLKQPTQLMSINCGGHFKALASVNWFLGGFFNCLG